MQKQGTIQRWDAARGFGFIRSPQTPADIFFHIKDYRGAAAPREGEAVWFEEITVGGKGPRAMAVRTATTPAQAAPQRQRRPAPRPGVHRTDSNPAFFALLTIGWICLLAWGVWAHRLPLWVLGAAVAVNLATFFAYWTDKHAARTRQWRTKEDSLHVFSLLGGWPGAGVAQAILRHKSSKAAFQATYWVTVVVHCAALLGWLFWLQPRMLFNQ
ncbi:uncharacterized membrane protein YsdA (DUF1294 family)/cold shock CspA family protein [Rhodoferax ferrireducens]|uniref:Uncharacterized membrane protein YsdA (DUF1294 family)/cold shock CspA family protein n=1 Tax=Rhodoferax ferrireducens TaxID=192843 RepID=A0ABU2C648_9BURK|nr:cold shock and DUF1294 domain-containing protein [Rhodoferax ferrireducens]MDR7376806.1 uncharacterized membrane protein YsdA (DUF1294 family)/cold shock CspA family protein [Rhodoferax ferrireducens]